VQVPPGATLVPHVFAKTNEDAFAPVTPKLPMMNGPAPVFVTVTLCDAVDVPTSATPNDMLVADNEMVVELAPVPESAMDCGEAVAVSVMAIAAVKAPSAVGSKWP